MNQGSKAAKLGLVQASFSLRLLLPVSVTFAQDGSRFFWPIENLKGLA